MPAFPTLLTPRLQLREIVTADVPALFDIHSDDDAMRWYGADPLLSLSDAEKLVNFFAGWRSLPNPGTRWGIALRTGGPLIGTCGLFKWNRSWRSCALGYELARAAWGQGLMQEALAATLQWGFENMALNRIDAQVHPENTASIKRLEALGFEREGLLRQAGFWLGEYRDLLQFSLLRQEHEAQVLPPRSPTTCGSLPPEGAVVALGRPGGDLAPSAA